LTRTVAIAELFVVSGSFSLPATDAVFSNVPGGPTVLTTMRTVAEAPEASVPSEQVTTPFVLAQLPWLAVAETNFVRAGIGSVTLTPVAVSGPWFVATIVNVTFLPGCVAVGEADFVTARSAPHDPVSIVVDAEEEPPACGFPEVIVAVFVTVPGAEHSDWFDTVVETAYVCDEPKFSVYVSGDVGALHVSPAVHVVI
jgi:hypothetical protein